MADTYVVKGLCVVVNAPGSFAQLLQRGAVLPDGVDPATIQHLLDQDLIAQAVPVGGLEPVYSGDLVTQVTALVETETKPSKSTSKSV